MKNKKRLFGIVLLAALVIMQFFSIDKTNPTVDSSKEFMTLVDTPAPFAKMLKNACYDCHSYETKYPSYTSVAPLSFWIRGHINNGREKLNLSVWSEYPEEDKKHLLYEMAEEIEEKHMPFKSYVWMHPEAKFTDEERSSIVTWLKKMGS